MQHGSHKKTDGRGMRQYNYGQHVCPKNGANGVSRARRVDNKSVINEGIAEAAEMTAKERMTEFMAKNADEHGLFPFTDELHAESEEIREQGRAEGWCFKNDCECDRRYETCQICPEI